ncbi:MAG: M1 family aminopeptidase [bacterium]
MRNIIRIFIGIIFIIFLNHNEGGFLFSEEISAPENYIPQPFDVTHYDAELDFTQYPTTAMRGVCRISVEWLESPVENKFYFHLRDLTIDSAFYQNLPVDAVEIGTKEDSTYHFEITPPPQLSTSSATITIYYHGNMTTEYNKRGSNWGGVKSKSDVLFVMGVGFYNNYVCATQHWLPCYDHPSDKASCKFKFVVPAGKEVASNGLLTEVIHPDNGTDIYVWEHNNDCATYNYTFAVSDWVPLSFGNENLPMVVYCKPADTIAVRTTFKLLPQMVENYSNRFGKYPFDKVGYVLTPSSGGSMEHETMVCIDQYVGKSKDTINETGAHELAHQWFGDMVTPYDFRDAWLNESFATFCESIWYEKLFGFEEFLNHQDDMRGFYLSNPSGAKGEGIFPVYDFPRTSPSSNYPWTIYKKGGAVVGMLRYELGDSIFFLAMSEYLSARTYSNANSDTLKYYCEKVSGMDLDWFFNQWIYGKGWPQLQISFESRDDGTAKLDLSQIQPDSFGVYINIPLEIGFEKPSGEYEFRMFKLNERQKSYELDLGFECKRLLINRGPNVRSLLEVKSMNIVSVEQEIAKGVLQLYPNPVSDKLTLSFPASNGNVVIKIYNETGKVVFRDTVVTQKANNIYNINTKDFSMGNYFVLIDYNGILMSDKFVIMR